MKRSALFFALLLAGSAAQAGVQVVEGITYCEVDGLNLEMDMAWDDVIPGPRPTVIFIHGGGWFNGTRELYSDETMLFAQDGYTAFTISYRLTSLPNAFDDPYAVGAQYPDPIDDVKCAVNHIFDNAAFYEVDTTRVALYGESSGGHLAMMTAYVDPRIKAIVSWYGPSQLSKLYRTSSEAAKVAKFMGGSPMEVGNAIYQEASPLNYVTEDSQPTLVIQGTGDTIVPAQQSRMLQQALAPLSPESRFLYIPGADHGVPGYRAQATETSLEFLNQMLGVGDARMAAY